MAMYFLDSSAIVKRYFQEQGHEWIETLHDPAQGHGLYIAQTALIEVGASICRKAREQHLPVSRSGIAPLLIFDAMSRTPTVVGDNALYTAAGDLCRSHRLQAYDAVQLACALAVRQDVFVAQSSAAQLPDVLFVSADLALLTMARAEGFNGEDPNTSA
jgi:predicted nucleic acid-binding protein